MKKTILLFAICIVLTLTSCSSDDDSSDNQDNLFNPPSWIIGTWLDESEPEWQQIGGFQFTNDNILDINADGETILNFKEAYANSESAGITVDEEETDSSYRVKIISNGVTNLDYKFNKNSDTDIVYELSSTYNIVLTKQ